ncbi:SUF system NifU family Fe-S cluster assembly protein [Patescibacteria group bacterium]|nr:SUF system NifU family Fe-S cluster assembly protein [Patescibacteria group bacterium]
MSIYSEVILDHYHHPRNFGKLRKPDLNFKIINPLCGDEIEFFINFDGMVIKEICFYGKGCAISIASSSMFLNIIKGKNKDELKKMDKDFIIKMLGIKIGLNRLKCALLPLGIVEKI